MGPKLRRLKQLDLSGHAVNGTGIERNQMPVLRFSHASHTLEKLKITLRRNIPCWFMAGRVLGYEMEMV